MTRRYRIALAVSAAVLLGLLCQQLGPAGLPVAVFFGAGLAMELRPWI
jgi:uncharacterized membrane protein YhhN